MKIAQPNYPFTFIHCHPLYYATIGLISGIALSYAFCSFFVPLLLLCLFCLVCCVGFYIKTTKGVFAVVVCGGLLVGLLRMQQQLMFLKTPWLESPKVVACKAVIKNISYTEQTFSTAITLAIEATQKQDSSWQSCAKTINWYTPNNRDLMVDDRIIIKNITINPAGSNDFGFYLLKEGIDGTVFAAHADYQLIERPAWSFKRSITQWRQQIFSTIKKKLSRPCFALFSSLFLGNRACFKKELLNFSEFFRQWGISHQLARSGLHLVIFSLVWERVLHYLPIPFVGKRLLLLMLGIMYYLLSWSSISFIRSFLSFMIYHISSLFLAPTQAVYTLFLVCFIVLFLNPAQLFFIDFQLSFGLTFALAWFHRLYNPYKIE